jgi:adenylosuccinate lyase
MQLSELTAISPIDGRYRAKLVNLAPYFSEYGWFSYRLMVEIEYFIALCEIPLPQLQAIDTQTFPALRAVYEEFNETSALEIKEIEKTTNHDIKALEYFLKNKMEALGLGAYKEFVHFGLTSQDINNTSIPILLKDSVNLELRPVLADILHTLKKLSTDWADIPMLARTHGQPASPTRLGKEIWIFGERLQGQLKLLETIPFSAKFGGATGNFNAHVLAYPAIDWVSFANNLLINLGIERTLLTTQIEPYDNLGALCDNIKRLNLILLDLCKDIWHYISLDYFKQKTKAGEIGSSAMPHKVNPIDFENAEGNLGMANAVLEFLASKLPISRLQRDLTDSTVLRNLGVPLAHSLVAWQSILKGLGKLELNEVKLQADLTEQWVVIAEGIQTILRREGHPNPYELLKDLTRGTGKMTPESFAEFVTHLPVTEAIKAEIAQITPFNYTGLSMQQLLQISEK